MRVIALLLPIFVCVFAAQRAEAKDLSAQDVVGDYLVEGTNPVGRPYQGVIEIVATPNGVVYARWTIDDEQALGIGFVRRGLLILSYYGNVAGTAVYILSEDDTMPYEGEWTVAGSEDVYKERLKKLPEGHPVPAPSHKPAAEPEKRLQSLSAHRSSAERTPNDQHDLFRRSAMPSAQLGLSRLPLAVQQSDSPQQPGRTLQRHVPGTQSFPMLFGTRSTAAGMPRPARGDAGGAALPTRWPARSRRAVPVSSTRPHGRVNLRGVLGPHAVYPRSAPFAHNQSTDSTAVQASRIHSARHREIHPSRAGLPMRQSARLGQQDTTQLEQILWLLLAVLQR